MKAQVIFAFLIFIIILFTTNEMMAQPPGLPATPSQAPVDGGLSLLAAAGGAYAIKKLRQSRKMDTEN